MVPGARIELATPAFSGRRSTNELPWHVVFRNCMGCSAIVSIRAGKAGLELRQRLRNPREEQFSAYCARSSDHCADSSNSFIQVFPLSTSRGRVPSGGPTMPSFSMMSIKWAARP